MKKIILKSTVLLMVFVSFCGCEAVKEIANMLNCTFERKNVDNFRFAGVSFNNIISFSDLKLEDVAKITLALATKTAPISFDINIEGKNPTKETAAIEQLKWILVLDDKEIVNGNVVDKFTIPAQQTAILPLDIHFDAMQILDDSTPESVFRLYQNITGKQTDGSSTMSLKIKPTISGIEFPEYITLKQTIN
jgi:hypothetical protein